MSLYKKMHIKNFKNDKRTSEMILKIFENFFNKKNKYLLDSEINDLATYYIILIIKIYFL